MGHQQHEVNEPSGLESPLAELHNRFFEAASPSMRAVELVVRELAQNTVPVLLVGELGAGKRTAARRIHELGGHAPEKFRVVHCGELTTEQLRAHAEEWFRHGTVFLQEIGDLSLQCQLTLVTVLSGVQPNGSEGDGRARLFCSSSRELEPEMRSGRFREDLYYRVSGVCLRLPPLRQRKEDIAGLTRFFLAKYAHDSHRPLPALSAQTQQLFNDYTWPGNIRELENVTRAIAVLGDEAVAMGGLRAVLKAAGSAQGERVSLKQAARAASREAEKELILRVLSRTRWNRRRAAQELQISYKALLYKLKQIGCGELETP